MKTAYQILKDRPDLMDDPEVMELMDSYEKVGDELIDLKQISEMNQEAALKELVDQIVKAIDHELKNDEESMRFKETPRVDFKQAVIHLKLYVRNYLKDYKIRIP